jgi:hypothetical protein
MLFSLNSYHLLLLRVLRGENAISLLMQLIPEIKAVLLYPAASHRLQPRNQTPPEPFHRGDVHLFIGAVGEADRWAAGDHLHCGEPRADDAAFETGVDGDDTGRFFMDGLICLLHDGKQRGIGNGLPAGVHAPV